MAKKTGIVDRPNFLEEKSKDSLGIEKYAVALMTFIRGTDLPTTIAIQGEWGSGKTSLMNRIKNELCPLDTKAAAKIANRTTKDYFHSVWINTWKYSLSQNRADILPSLILGMIKQLSAVAIEEGKQEKEKVGQQITGLVKNAFSFVKSLTKMAVASTDAVIGADGTLAEMILGSKDKDSQTIIDEIRNQLKKIIEDLTESRQGSTTRKGIIFFIDDLDRIEPALAVQMLEVIKNLFDIDKCLFVLAIDYEVVVKGLESKFGKLTKENEREFRSFFDKIIQMPFSMPTESYPKQMKTYLIELLGTEIGYIKMYGTGRPVSNWKTPMEKYIPEMAQYTVGSNPRSVKRLVNTLSLINILMNPTPLNPTAVGEKLEDTKDDVQVDDKVIIFGLVCLQVAYPAIYRLLLIQPDFTSWTFAGIGKRLNLQDASPEIRHIAGENIFDDEWERIIFSACSNDVYLSKRAVDIAKFFNILHDVIKSYNKEIRTAITDCLERAAIANVESEHLPI